MHEMSIALAVVEQVEEALDGDEAGTGSVGSVRLEVGELAGVVPDALEFSFSLACAGTRLEGAALHLDAVPGRARCTGCGAEWATGMPPRLCCAECGGAGTELLAGRELRITAVEYCAGHAEESGGGPPGAVPGAGEPAAAGPAVSVSARAPEEG
ncbi:hydrogenase maturation nickel metallochaperone HypA [Streptomyces sp. JJ36]|uniref:hydrogenase maturation nickel metallochaperone HypA/HybF n=1 Tax=Streptomyces sp. JJ36 TaxID=2736645 RepID=UPI001F1DA64F|nr:hydrogenase maturation nickel metallochaperone HypA [Streptomyces sp. JJ36]MCF6521922.1 hydrogenase maturation nickel metallochaperone HypA [Streptomyces sp. JJ36]